MNYNSIVSLGTVSYKGNNEMTNKATMAGFSGLLDDVDLTGIYMDAASDKIDELEADIAELEAENTALVEAADASGEDISDDDLETITNNKATIERKTRQIAARQGARTPTAGSKLVPGNREAAPRNKQTVEPTARKVDPKGGFVNFGEFAKTVHAASPSKDNNPSQEAINRLQNALTTYGNEGVGSDGGFLVPPDFRREISQKVLGEEALIARTDRMTSASNSVLFPTDETTPYGTNGVQAYWESEGGLKTQSKPAFGQNALRLNKLIALVPVSDEMLEDAPLIDSYLRRRVPEVMTAKVNSAIISGTGAGQPLGFMNSPGTITVSKETSQPADTIYFANLVNMYSRMRASSLPRSVWLINQSILPQLLTMSFDPDATAGKVPVYLPGGMAANAPFGTLLGRPILPVEGAAALGDLGDIALVDFSQYLTVTKGQDIKSDVSMHLFFDYDVTAFRFVFRVAGQPWWNSPVTPLASGAATLSSFVTLEARG